MGGSRQRYLIRSVMHAAQVLSAFQFPGEVLRLREVCERTGFGRGVCYRLAYTLHECGLLEKVGENQYRLSAGTGPSRRFRIGYGSQGQDSSFPRAVLAGLSMAAERNSMELIVVDNRYNAKVTLRNAEQLAREQLDLVIEFQADEAVAAEVAAKYRARNIAMIAVDMPHPGATYFGANNYVAGFLAGRHLGRWAKLHWEGTADSVLLIGLARAGWVAQSRFRGVLKGLAEALAPAAPPPAVTVEGDGQFLTAMEAVRRYLAGFRGNRVLVSAANDPSALGALRAFEEAGRAGHCVVVSHNAEAEARVELREPRTRLIGSVAFFPEQYGEHLISLASAMLAHKTVPPACFIKHKLITPENVDHFYPNDPLFGNL